MNPLMLALTLFWGWFSTAPGSRAGGRLLIVTRVAIPPPGGPGRAMWAPVRRSTEDVALQGVNLSPTALELEDHDTQFNPSLHFCTCKTEIIIPSSQSRDRDRWR